MPSLYRVDPRLVHATLINAWVPALDATAIMVADGRVQADSRRRAIYELSAMDLLPVHFCEETKLTAALSALDSSEDTIVLFSRLQDVLQAQRADVRIPELMIGHVPASLGRKELHPSVHLGEAELEQIRALEQGGAKVMIRPLPVDEAKRPWAESASPSKASGQFTVLNERGLHLRAAHTLAHLASAVRADVRVGRNGELVNAKSLLGLTTLGATRGTVLDVVVTGEGAQETLQEIEALFACGFHEGLPEA